jgi:putative SOS response-associated peptidase YedK
MCGRYTQTQELDSLRQFFGFSAPETELSPRYNIAPGQYAPVVVLEDGERRLRLMRWGLVPSWAKDEKIGNKLINARGETLAQKPSFRSAFKARRCLVLADGFYEWVKLAAGKQPVYLRLKDGRPFAFAGVYERWDKGEDEPLYTFTIVTTEPNEMIREIHSRMPVMLHPKAEEIWLDPQADPEELEALLIPYPPVEMVLCNVSKQVNSPRNEGPALIEPLFADESQEGSAPDGLLDS